MPPDDPGDDKLLPGESSSSSSGSRQEAAHWVEVYQELVGFKDRLMSELRRQGAGVRSEGQAELDSDERLLRRENDRLHRRLRFWKRKLVQR
jgi:hypothetical protein